MEGDADDDSTPPAVGTAAPAPLGEAADAGGGPAGTLGFWKALSSFDVSLSESSAPGQMIIPIRFRDFFGELVIQKDETAQRGVRQSHAVFPATFIDGAFSAVLEDTRVILYEPAVDHPRQNIELRYTFHNREVLQRLFANDILIFTREDQRMRIEPRQPDSMGAGRFGHL